MFGFEMQTLSFINTIEMKLEYIQSKLKELKDGNGGDTARNSSKSKKVVQQA